MILTSHRESSIHINTRKECWINSFWEREKKRKECWTKAWWSLCVRMLDWSNYLLSIKLPNIKMATLECKSFLSYSSISKSIQNTIKETDFFLYVCLSLSFSFLNNTTSTIPFKCQIPEKWTLDVNLEQCVSH